MTRKKSSISRLAAALLVVLPALLLGACTKTYDYHDYASKEAFFNHPIDPYKWDYLLTGDPAPEPVCGCLYIETYPHEASISLDGDKAGGSTPSQINGVTEGKHVVTIRYGSTRVKCTFYQTESEDHALRISFKDGAPPSVAFDNTVLTSLTALKTTGKPVNNHMNKNEEALPWAEKAVRAFPEDVYHIGTLASVYRDLGRYKEALSQLELCLKLMKEQNESEDIISKTEEKIKELKKRMM